MRTGSRVRLALFALALAAPLSAQLPAQQQPAPRGGSPPANRLEMERRLQQAFAQRVREQLGLNAGQATALGDATLEFQRQRQALVRRENELRRRYRMGAAEAGGGGNAPAIPDAEAMEILRELRALRAEELNLYTREQERLLQLLSPAQVVRYYLLREQLADRINGLRGGPGPGAGRGAPAGGRRAPGPPPPGGEG